VLDEIGFALHKKKHIVPVLIRPCDMPFRLLRFQFVDCSQDYRQGLRELLEDLQKMGLAAPNTAKPPTSPLAPEPKKFDHQKRCCSRKLFILHLLLIKNQERSLHGEIMLFH